MMKFAAANLTDLPRVAHAFFGRKGGVSTGLYESLNCGPGSDDNPDAVAENRRRAMAELGENAKLATLYQVHGSQTLVVDDVWPMNNRPTADAMVTTKPGIALGILTADCAPVLLADAEAGVIGAAHAGWKGALAGVTDTVVADMAANGAERWRICAAIGPTIAHGAYEVGTDMKARFAVEDQSATAFFTPGKSADRWQFDLPGYVAHRLRAAGVEDVHIMPACTYALEQNFFSYRRSTHRKEPDNGRQLSAIMLVA